MAQVTFSHLEDTWSGLRANPVFQRAMVPRSLRWLMRSPLPRAAALTLVALAAYETIVALTFSLWLALTATILFWFVIMAVQRAFCWMELTALARTGNLGDYLNSGLGRADVALGVIYPAVISETLAVTGILVWFLISGTHTKLLAVLLIVIIFMRVRSLFEPPALFLPDVESYMRRRGTLALISVGIATLVPLVIFFSIYYALLFGALYGLIAAGFNPDASLVVIGAFIATMFASRWVVGRWQMGRLRRFYARNASFDDLFDEYMQAAP